MADEVRLGVAVVPVRVSLDELDKGLSEARTKIEGALTGAWEQAGTDVEAVQSRVQDLGSSIQRDIGDRGAEGISRAGGALREMVKGIGLATAQIAIFQMAFNKVLDFGETGARLMDLERSFTGFAERSGRSADRVLAEMQRMSAGMLTQSELMEQYNRAYLLMGEEMADQLPRLIQVATAATAAGMGDFQYMLNSLTVGLGRLSPMILDNLGFTIQLSEAYQRYALSVGKAVDELTKAEQQQALYNAIMEQAEAKFGDLDDAAEQMAGKGIARLRAAWKDLADEMNRVPVPVIDAVAEKLASGMRMNIQYTDEFNERLVGTLGMLERIESGSASIGDRLALGMEKLRNWMVPGGLGWTIDLSEVIAQFEVATMSAEEFAVALKQVQAVSPSAAAEMQRVRNEALGTAADVQRADRRLLELASAFREMGAGARTAQVDLQALNGAIGSSISLVQNLSGAARDAQGSLQAMAVDLRVSMMKAQDYAKGITRPQLDWYTTGKAAWELPEAYKQYTRDLGSWIEGQGRKAWSDHEASIRGAGGAYNDLQRQMEAYYESWRQQAAGILQPTQQFDMDSLIEEVYGYQDKWDEAARRAMDVVKLGTDSPWAAEMGLGGKEDALQYIRDFYAGRLPEDVNWEAAIGKYQLQMEQMLGQQSLQAMFEEKLIGAGWGPDNTSVMAALEAPFEPGGVNSAAAFAQAFVDHDWDGTAVTASDRFLGALSDELSKGAGKYSRQFESFVVTTVERVFFGGAKP